MSEFDIIIGKRDFSGNAIKLPLNWSVERLSKNIMCGPERATLTASGDMLDMAELANQLRCPVEVRYNPIGEVVWSGYIESVTIPMGGVDYSASIANLTNRAAVAYSFVASGSGAVGERKTTAWAQDDNSVSLWGSWETLYSTSGASDAEAEAIRDSIISDGKQPHGDYMSGYGQGVATVECAGWFTHLDRKYYANSGKSYVESTTKIASIITAEGEFITSTRIINPSGINRTEYADGDNTAFFYIFELLQSGVSGGRRLMGTVTKDRIYEIREEPAKGVSDTLRRANGRLEDAHGREIILQTCPVGYWMRTVDVLPANISGLLISDPSYGFVEAATWTPQGGYEPVMRGMPSAADLAANIIKEG